MDARYVIGDDEIVISRAVPRDGRSRAYINGSISTVSSLQEITENLIEIHGQHGHTSLEKTSELLKALDIGVLHAVIGPSMGGMSALSFCQLHPGKAKS